MEKTIKVLLTEKEGGQFLRLAQKFLRFTLSLALVCCFLPASAEADSRQNDIIGNRTLSESGITASSAPSISAAYAYVADSEGNVYFQRDAQMKSNIASITKIMTAIVALGVMQPEDTVDVSEYAASIGESSAMLKAGDKLSLKDAIVGLMIPSGNDAATAIAECAGKRILEGVRAKDLKGDAIEYEIAQSNASAYDAFVCAMNSTAKHLGCTDTLFTNPHGLDIDSFSSEMYSTAKDVCTFSEYAMDNSLFKEIVSKGDQSIIVERSGAKVQIELESTDLLLGNYEGACGIKTGYTETAGSCFSGACLRDGSMLYAVVLGCPDNDVRFSDVRTLFDWVYNSKLDLPISNTDKYISVDTAIGQSDVAVVAYVAHDDWLDKTFAVSFSNPRKTISVSSIFGNVSQDVIIEKTDGTIHIGDIVGRVDFYQGNERLSSENLISCEEIKAPNILESISIAWQKFRGNNKGAHTEVCNDIQPIVQKV